MQIPHISTKVLK